ncbi:hypothetical protein GCWU000325_02673 [Alloprevotella tannerae ATCC 51259]|uniref:Uncharacterized protein n=1 Tax=Alloprevotella tannerae ATCC 51259 TaxID=626522 RepID=C9LKA8_9BACT|nr:hypothetical protein GCWU000325_02673 [Alloprevotella tannerae ATCC 51259]
MKSTATPTRAITPTGTNRCHRIVLLPISEAKVAKALRPTKSKRL